VRVKVAIAGCGSIGVAFAVLFADAGHQVRCWDPDEDARSRARRDIEDRAVRLAEHHLLNDEVHVTLARVTITEEMEAAAHGAEFVQECAPEQLAIKQEVLSRLAELTGAEVALASSSSAMTPSTLACASPAADRIVVGHPGNPPYLLPIIELVPSPQTRPEVVALAEYVYESAGLEVIRVGREVEGFVFNRLQGALLREAYCLVRDGVASVEDVDAVVRLGLGRRWSVVGPFETADLNTRGGVASHAEKLGPAYARMGAERGQHDPWTPDLVSAVAQARRAVLPLDEWEERVIWRDEELMRLAANQPVRRRRTAPPD
jgi:3-hydroxyacyl-CoA dehydrogenase